MPLLLFLAFLAIPLVELWVILQVGEVIGAWWTILLLIADSIAGAYVVRREGGRAWRAFRQALAEGRWPGDEVAQGAFVLIGGALLVTPGFVTDFVGLTFVLPPTRRFLSRFVRHRLTPSTVRVVDLSAEQMTSHRRQRPTPDQDSPQVYDVEVVSIEPDEEDEDR